LNIDLIIDVLSNTAKFLFVYKIDIFLYPVIFYYLTTIYIITY